MLKGPRPTRGDGAPVTNDAEYIKDFVLEGHENLDRIESLLLRLEKDPHSQEMLAEVFRAFHTIKGTSRMFEFRRVEKLSHAAEDLLSRLREGQDVLTTDNINWLLRVIGTLRQRLSAIEKSGVEDAGDDEPVLTNTAAAEPEKTPGTGLTENTLRVNVTLLDRLMAEVGELVLTRNRVLQWSTGRGDSEIALRSQQLNAITTEIQRQVMQMRLQPIGHAWNKAPRLVRDLCAHLGKRARLTLEGADTELDKSILEGIRDPLTHLIRNAVDHGIETPAQRGRLGKAPEGTVALRAEHESGWVLLEIADDGAGIDPARLRERAVKKGVLTADEAGRLGDRETVGLIFRSGFSTTESVTEVSGRGIGLDVVKENIEKLGGAIDVLTAPGRGTTFQIRIPLTLSIVPTLIVTDGQTDFAIPQAHVVEMVRLGGERAAHIEWMEDAAVFRLRGRLLPLVFLRQALRREPPPAAAAKVNTLVVLRAGARPFGLVVDRAKDTEEIVEKPLGRHFKGLPFYEGATIMGDGRVVPILDVVGLAESAHVISALERSHRMAPTAPPAPPAEKHDALLLVAGADDSRAALPLDRVDRVEEIAAEAIERVGGREMIQYRGELLPLQRLSALLRDRRQRPRFNPTPEPAELLPVVVCHSGNDRRGLVVHRILEMVDVLPEDRRPASRPGVVGTVIARGRITEILDLDRLFAAPDAGSAPA